MQTHKEQLIADRYLLQGLIRTHGLVALYAAHDEQLDRLVMVQRLAASTSGDPELARTFLRHQQIAASIHNCPLLAVYDAGMWEGKPFSVMECEKGRPAGALYRPGYPPDVPAALRVTRQIAEALQCCRDEGLTDWTFAPEAVSIDSEGNGCLAIIEGLEGQYSSKSVHRDVEALGGLLRLMLRGNPDPGISGADTALIPKVVTDLLDRMASDNPNAMRTAGEVGMAIAAIEQASYQPTQAYEPAPAMALPETRDGNTTAAFVASPAARPALEAATLAAQAAPAALAPTTTPLQGYVPSRSAVETANQRPQWLLLAAVIGALLLTAVLLAVALPRLRTQSTSTATTPTRQAQQMALVPDLRGKSLDDARETAGNAGLNLSEADPLRDGTFPTHTVARQEPAPGTQLQAGSLITVSLSLGPEAKPTIAPQHVTPTPQPRPQHPGKKDPQKGKGKDH